MFAKKKLTFQLTPLLDLLLIVIFAQYMEVQQTSARAEQEIARRADEQTAAALKAQMEAERRLAELQGQRQSLQGQLEDQLADLSEEMQDVLNQRKDLADFVARLFQIPKEVLERALAATEKDRAGARADPQHGQRARRRAQEQRDQTFDYAPGDAEAGGCLDALHHRGRQRPTQSRE
jgi:septal ring factor EnvC (AmiA/AmiB activator)